MEFTGVFHGIEPGCSETRVFFGFPRILLVVNIISLRICYSEQVATTLKKGPPLEKDQPGMK